MSGGPLGAGVRLDVTTRRHLEAACFARDGAQTIFWGRFSAILRTSSALLARWAGRVGWRILGLLGLVGVAVLLLLSVARPALAAGPQEQIQKVLDAVAAVLKDPSRQGPDKQADLEKVGLSRQLP